VVTALDMKIRDLESLDWPEVARIFEDGIRSGNATFELEPPTWEDWDGAHSEIRVVAELDGRIVGWAALSPKSARRCYRGVAESSVYVEEGAQGRGIGRALMDDVIARAEAAGLWTLEAGIFPENKASLRLHLGCGFRLVGVRERLGEANGEFRDVLLLERRSEVI
jgi:L-amino acid N-acyltransferase YncA